MVYSTCRVNLSRYPGSGRYTDIDPYLRFPLQVDVASMMKELGDLLELEPSEDEAGVASRDQPALPGDVENFDAVGTAFWPCLLLGLVFCVGLSCVLACVGFMKGLGVYGTENLGRITTSLCAKVCAVCCLVFFEWRCWF